MIKVPKMSNKLLFARVKKVREHCVVHRHGRVDYKITSLKNYKEIWGWDISIKCFHFSKDFKRAVNAASKEKYGMKWKKVARSMLKFKK